MAKKLSNNEVINIANNYGYLYGVHTIHEELKPLLKMRGTDKFFYTNYFVAIWGGCLERGSTTLRPN